MIAQRVPRKLKPSTAPAAGEMRTGAMNQRDLGQFLSCCVLLGFVQVSPLPEGRVDLSAADPGYSDSEIAIISRDETRSR